LRASCLAESVTLTAVMTRAGERPVLVLGCRRYDDGHWGAHAWVVVNEEVLEPIVAGVHAELARLSFDGGWEPT